MARRGRHPKLTEFQSHAPLQIHSEDIRAEQEVGLDGIGWMEERKGRDSPWQHGVQVALVGPDVGQAHAVLGIPIPSRVSERPRADHRSVGAAVDLHEPQFSAAHLQAAVGRPGC